MAEFKTVSLADQVFEKLENDIIFGVYPQGEVLTELKLAEQLGVSRTPIREALRRLEEERLIADSGKGSVVLGITVEDLMDIMGIRQHVEGLASAYAAKNITQEGIRALEHIIQLQDFYYQQRDLDHLRQQDDCFHDTLCDLSKRVVLRDTLRPLHRKTRRYRKISLTDESRMRQSIAEHRDIADAVSKGDAERAYSLTWEHIANAKNHMIERLDYHG
ncbi:MAG: GntR family transcriptional regulator [Firmicutes bacterium]|nr:GntR family transcriptional regulator [Bacillota bacterium]